MIDITREEILQMFDLRISEENEFVLKLEVKEKRSIITRVMLDVITEGLGTVEAINMTNKTLSVVKK